MAIVSERQQPKQDEIGQLLSDQKLLPNKDLLARNFDEVIHNLEDCDAYIQTIIVSIYFHGQPKNGSRPTVAFSLSTL